MQLITDILISSFEKHKNNTAFLSNKTREVINYNDAKYLTYKIFRKIKELNLTEKEPVIMYMRPQPLYHMVDLAVLLSKNISVLCDYTYNFSDLEFILQNTEAKIIFTDNIDFINKIQHEDTSLTTIFYIGDSDITSVNEKITIYNLNNIIKNMPNEDNIVQEAIDPEETATILFSSGTTGKPKGVLYTYKSITCSFLSHHKAGLFKKKGCCVSILSASHIAPKLCDWSILAEGNCIIYSDYLNYRKDIKKFKPLYLQCVPKLILLHKDDYYNKLEEKSKLFKYWHNIFYKLSEKFVKLQDKDNLNIIEFLKMFFYKFCNYIGIKLFFGKISKEIGLRENINMIAFGACLDIHIETLYFIIGTKLLINYGLTEGGTLTYINLQNRKLGSVGKINPDLSVIICDPETNKELPRNSIGVVKAKGPQIMKEYYKNEEETKKVFDENGYLTTGDMAYITQDGFLMFKGRYKNIIVLNNGENINPEEIEEACKNSPFVSQIMLFGQDKPFLTAIIVPDKEYIKKQYNTDNANNIKKEVIIDINNLLGEAKFFKWIHQVKDVLFTDEAFTQENGLLTKKFSLNRGEIYKKYKNLVEGLYENEK